MLMIEVKAIMAAKEKFAKVYAIDPVAERRGGWICDV